jgi:hypothetical protein
MYIVTSFYISLHTAVLHVHCHLFFMLHYTQLYFLCVVKHKKKGNNVHEVQLCVVKHKKEVTMYMKYSFVVKYKKEVTMYVSLHRAVLHVHCHLFFMLHYTELYFMYIVTSFLYFVVKHKKEVTMYMKYSFV